MSLPCDHHSAPIIPASFSTVDHDRQRTVLLVEDDLMLAQLLERILVGAGYDVSCCASGTDALNVVEGNLAQVDVVISDVGLPGLTGDQLALELRRIRPALPILLMTGFSETVTPETVDRLGVLAVLQKPMTGRHLLAAVQDALLRRHSPTDFEASRPGRPCEHRDMEKLDCMADELRALGLQF